MDKKSPDAFRTISEVAEWLDTPAHVLRFWESRFAQVKPVKRAGGRRYYRPADMLLLGGIKKLLHEDGMTIRGVQKLLREEGVKHVASFSAPVDGDAAMKEAKAPAKPTQANTEADLTVDEAPMQVDVPQDPLENVVQLAASAPEADDTPEPPSETEAEADLADLERLDGPVPADDGATEEPDTEALFAESLNAPEADAEDNTAEPVLPFGRGRVDRPAASPATEPARDAPPAPAPRAPEEPQAPAALGSAIPDDPEDSDLHPDVIPPGYDMARLLRAAQANGGPTAEVADKLLPYYARLVALRSRMDKH